MYLSPYLKSELKLARLKAIQALDSAEWVCWFQDPYSGEVLTNKVPILQNHITALGKLSHSGRKALLKINQKSWLMVLHWQPLTWLLAESMRKARCLPWFPR